ncbi:cellulase [Mycena alexandri]|uniref:Cellulase n=1 Tax=Mycena alexandri TaxID=1745969 RepID=A0AAD6STT6_9AGAR|nr:cellulase [Mycena alexandri]
MRFSLSAIALCLAATVLNAARLTRRQAPAWTGPLSTSGRWVVDANGNRFRLTGGNWHGASGTWTDTGDINQDANYHAGENAHTMPLGLQYVPIDEVIDSFVDLSINTIRLQFLNQMLHDTTIIDPSWVAANPQFQGMTCLEVYDAVIAALTARGIAVISQTFATWISDWLFVVNRYKSNKRVVGADLYNEVRHFVSQINSCPFTRRCTSAADWGNGDNADWQAASQSAADSINQANPDLLIIVEGINWIGLPVDGLPHSRPTLTPVALLSHTLLVSHKLVYSAHFYSYTGPNHSGATGIGETEDPRYRDLNQTTLFSIMDSEASYVAQTPDMHYTAPVWFSEFGIPISGNLPADTAWFLNFMDYLVLRDVDFAFWPLVGYLNNGTGNGWALMNWDYNGVRTDFFTSNDWREPAWSTVLAATGTEGQIAPVPQWKQLTLDHGDFIKSLWALANIGDYDDGAFKAMCPDGLRLTGLSHGSTRGLCSDVTFGNLWSSSHANEVVFDERHVTNDWASGYTKYTCPPNYFVSGWAIRGAKLSTVMCAEAATTLGTNGRTVWFNQGDNLADEFGGDFANGQYKGTCAVNEYIGGVAFTTALFNADANGAPDAIYCVS